ncbi:MAG: nucleotide exchange factor GrpE [Candidatus Paceibacterota bacterium]|jgi:molecular chaperone GrpE
MQDEKDLKDNKTVPPEETSDDVVFEDTEEAHVDLPAKLKKLKDKLSACEKEKSEYLDGWQRSKADFINYRKDQEKSNRDFIKFANLGLIEELIPVLDSFEMAFSNKVAWEKADKNWRVGVEYIHSQLHSILEKNHLKSISPRVGDEYDHTNHEAIESVPVEDKSQDHKIVEVISKGYEINGRVVKAARVKVGERKV